MPQSSDSSNPTFFATTRWTLVNNAARGNDTGAMEALGTLFGTYWQPLYRYVRRIGRSVEDAEDLVQGFFAHLLQQNGLRLVNRDRGHFRAFLLGSLKHYMANEWQSEHRLKRGGYIPNLSLDWQEAENGLCIELDDSLSPDNLYDRDWATALLNKVLDDLASQEKDFTRWKPFLSISSNHLSYQEIATEFGITEGGARVAVHRLRKRYRQRLRDEIASTLSDENRIDDEMKSLFAALS